MTSAIRERGREQVLYEELMGALGYKHNRLPFRKIATLLPLAMALLGGMHGTPGPVIGARAAR